MSTKPIFVYHSLHGAIKDVLSGGKVKGPKKKYLGKVLIMVPRFELWDPVKVPDAPDASWFAGREGYLEILSEKTTEKSLEKLDPPERKISQATIDAAGLHST